MNRREQERDNGAKEKHGNMEIQSVIVHYTDVEEHQNESNITPEFVLVPKSFRSNKEKLGKGEEISRSRLGP